MNVGRILIGVGLTIAGIGVLFLVAGKLNLPLGRLPGDIVHRGRGTTFYFPVVTCLIISVIGTVLLWLLGPRR